MVSMSTGDSSLTLGEDQDGIHFTQYKCIVTLIYQICPADIGINMNSFTMLKPKPIYLTLYCASVQCKCCCAVAVSGFTCVRWLTGVHIAVDAPPPGLIISRFLRLTPSVHCGRQARNKKGLSLHAVAHADQLSD